MNNQRVAELLLSALLTTLSGSVASCSHNSDKEVPVPRRMAYYRLQLPDAIYSPVNINGVNVNINTSVSPIATSQPGWFTGLYPDSMATIYITVTHTTPSLIGQAIDNRVERLAINTGGLPTEVISQTTPCGAEARMLVTHDNCPTPVQFLITDHNRLIISGMAVTTVTDATQPDSIAPIIEMLSRDIGHLISTISLTR